MSDTGSNDPYDPNRPSQPGQPSQPQWGSNPPPPAPGSGAGGWQPEQQQPYGAPGQYGQPGQYAGYGQPTGAPPPNYLVWAVLTTLLCCQPLGIPSVYYAARVNALYEGGNQAAAWEASKKAKQFAIWAVGAFLIVAVLYVLLFVVVASSGDSSS